MSLSALAPAAIAVGSSTDLPTHQPFSEAVYVDSAASAMTAQIDGVRKAGQEG